MTFSGSTISPDPAASLQIDGEPAPGPSLAHRTTRGFLWLLLQSVSGRAGSFLSQLVLARLLMPQAFGEIGLATTVTGMVGALIAFGIDDILLQRQRSLRFWVTAAFWSSFGLALIGMVLMCVAAPFAAHIYKTPQLVGLVAVAAINLPIGALSTVPEVRLRAAMNFRFLGTYASIETLAIQLAVVLLALVGCGAYSFVAPLPVFAAIKAIIFWRRAPARITLRCRPIQLRYMIGSGMMVQAGRMLIEIVNQGDYIVLGLMATNTVVGMYFFAFRLSAQPLRMLAGNVGAVIFPALTRLGGDRRRQQAAAMRASRIVAYTVTPVCYLQAALAGPVLHFMFGAKWAGAVILVQILSLGLPGDAVSWISGGLLVARREFKRDLKYLAAFAAPFFVFVLLGAWLDSALGVAIGVAIYYALVKPINSWLIFRDGMTRADFVEIYITPTLVAGMAFGAAYAASRLQFCAGSDFAQAMTVALIGPALYVAALRLFAPIVLREVFDRFAAPSFLRRATRRLGFGNA